MEQGSRKKFTALDAELLCECKTITAPLDYSMDMHNHDGYEVLLVLGGLSTSTRSPAGAGWSGETWYVWMNWIFTGWR